MQPSAGTCLLHLKRYSSAVLEQADIRSDALSADLAEKNKMVEKVSELQKAVGEVGMKYLNNHVLLEDGQWPTCYKYLVSRVFESSQAPSPVVPLPTINVQVRDFVRQYASTPTLQFDCDCRAHRVMKWASF